ncbi:MAG TPA: flagellar hook-basal body complex protein FliE [Acidimicrobiales bacterium]|nr:flagellar hook-basal body complex protein FliE [Acidimicrobiales bacterium]
MSVLPVGATAGAMWPGTPQVQGPGLTQATAPTAPTAPPGTSAADGGGSFANLLGATLDNLQSTQAAADNMATQAATGSLTNVADYMVTAEEANIQTQLTAAVRNNALQAFQQIMGMSL